MNNAEKLFTLASERRAPKKNFEYKKIIRKLKQHAKKGAMSAYMSESDYTNIWHDAMVAMLENDGFDVNYRGYGSYVISWEKKND